jgi:hypothetical protein
MENSGKMVINFSQTCTRTRTIEADEERLGETPAGIAVHQFREAEERDQFGRGV